MDHGSGNMTGMAECKIEMMWNWYTIDACFLASSWHIKNNAMFIASCIGVALLVVCLELLRRVSKEYEAHLVRSFQRRLQALQALEADVASAGDEPVTPATTRYATFRASPLQQFGRALIHGAILAVAYIVMLLVMHYNGYIFISVIFGSVLGKFLCDWLVVRIPYSALPEREEKKTPVEASGPTGCCA
ncbi:high affinity copper transporter [Corynespora cassiicola Philippines]|uniref:Copper transport protein n=1 Tax=Corynespora cassiicola Philippines TaxID=1448308 RepID=A0A2T2NIQ4_CORCC|nr:high affinity copper transporter [Corynespora cassiicola Philippines]